jgi:hypothetical protein
MMKRLMMGLALAGSAATIFTGCYSAPVMPPPGFIYSQYSAPLDVDYQETSAPKKTGTAQSMSILGLIAMGDCSAQTAAQAGGISKIDGADYTFFNVLGIYQRFDTVVYGE